MSLKSKPEKQREHTERVALELYHNRLRLGKPGDAHSDWQEAEKIVRSPIRTTLFASNRPFMLGRNPIKQAFKVIAWDTPKWFLFSLPQSEWMKLLAVPLALAAAGSLITGQIQREANQNAVLKAYFDKLEKLTFEQNLLGETPNKPNQGAVVLARGRTVAALRELDLSRRTQLIAFLQASDLSKIKEEDPVEEKTSVEEKDLVEPVISFREQNLSGLDLRGVNLSGLDFRQADLKDATLKEAILFNATLKEAYLIDANLQGASLENANLQQAYLFNANLQQAYLFNANLQGASLENANLQGAILTNVNLQEASLFNANLQGASLENANLQQAYLGNANLEGAILTNANLEGASLGEANLEGAYLFNANLQGAVLWGGNLQEAILANANLQGAKNLTQDQLTLALLCRTTLPEGITLDPNRDCEELGVDPETGEWIEP